MIRLPNDPNTGGSNPKGGNVLWCVFPLRPGFKSYRNALFTGAAIVAIGMIALEMTLLQTLLVTLVAMIGNVITPFQLRTLHLPVHQDQIVHIAQEIKQLEKDYQQFQTKENQTNV